MDILIATKIVFKYFNKTRNKQDNKIKHDNKNKKKINLFFYSYVIQFKMQTITIFFKISYSRAH